MSAEAFALLFVAAAAVLALWLVQRFASSAPQSLLGVVAHVVVANLASSAAMPLTVTATPALGPVPALMLVALPPLVYFFVACAWLLLFLQRRVTQLR